MKYVLIENIPYLNKHLVPIEDNFILYSCGKQICLRSILFYERKYTNPKFSDKYIQNQLNIMKNLKSEDKLEIEDSVYINEKGLSRLQERISSNIITKLLSEKIIIEKNTVIDKISCQKERILRESKSPFNAIWLEYGSEKVEKLLRTRIPDIPVLNIILDILCTQSLDIGRSIFRRTYGKSRTVRSKSISRSLMVNLKKTYHLYTSLGFTINRIICNGYTENFQELFDILYCSIFLTIRLYFEKKSTVIPIPILIISYYSIYEELYGINKSAYVTAYCRQIKGICLSINQLIPDPMNENLLVYLDNISEWAYREIGVNRRIRQYQRNQLSKSIDAIDLLKQLTSAYYDIRKHCFTSELIFSSLEEDTQYIISLLKVSLVIELGSKRIGEFSNASVFFLNKMTTDQIISYSDNSMKILMDYNEDNLFSFFICSLDQSNNSIESIVFYWNIAKSHDASDIAINRVVILSENTSHLLLPKRVGILYKFYLENYWVYNLEPMKRKLSSSGIPLPIWKQESDTYIKLPSYCFTYPLFANYNGNILNGNLQVILYSNGINPTLQQCRNIFSNFSSQMNQALIRNKECREIIGETLPQYDPLYKILLETQVSVERHTIDIFNASYNNKTLNTQEEKLYLFLLWLTIHTNDDSPDKDLYFDQDKLYPIYETSEDFEKVCNSLIDISSRKRKNT